MHDHLTNQQISKKFANQFDLVNYAIRLVENMIKSGRAPRVKVDVDNPVVQILAEIEVGKDKFDDIIEIKKEEVVEEEPKLSLFGKEKKSAGASKSGEKRKARIMH